MKRYLLVLLAIFLVDFHTSYLVAGGEAESIILSPIEPQQFQDEPIVSAVIEGSPAAIAGLEVGDLIISMNEKEVRTKGQFVEVLRKEKANGTVSFCVLRNGMTQTLTAQFQDPSQRFGIDIGDYFLMARKESYPTMFQRKGNFGMGANGAASCPGIVKFNIRIDNFSRNDVKISSDSIVVTAEGTELHRLSLEDVASMLYPKARKLEKAVSFRGRPLNRKEQSLLRRQRKELKLLSQLDLKDCYIPSGGFIIGSLFYDNSAQAYPIDLEVEVDDQVFNFSFEKEIE